MDPESTTVERVRLLIREVLSVEVPHDDTDMVSSGLLDSLALVSLIAEVEHEFELELPLDDLDVDQFRSAERIARLVASVHAAAT
jgi:acyl carrier protein